MGSLELSDGIQSGLAVLAVWVGQEILFAYQPSERSERSEKTGRLGRLGGEKWSRTVLRVPPTLDLERTIRRPALPIDPCVDARLLGSRGGSRSKEFSIDN